MVRSTLLLARLLLVAAALVTAYGAFAPVGDPRPHLFPWDKAEHFTAFFALTVLSLAAFPKVRVLWLCLALSAVGALIELIQATPWVARDADVFDWVADTCAILAVLLATTADQLRRWMILGGGRPTP